MKTIGIVAPLDSSRHWRLFDTLGEALNVRFEERKFEDNAGIDAWFFPEVNAQNLHFIANSIRPCYVVTSSNQPVPRSNSLEIKFSRHPSLSPVLRGRQIQANEAIELKVLPKWLPNVTALATKGEAPIWAMQEVSGYSHHYVSWPVPQLNNGESPSQYFQQGQFIRLVPLLHFLHSLTEDQRWEPPPLQACFMFDDPNLHWPSYGFIDFSVMLHHAQKHQYHVSFATIPLDAWFVHRHTASLFKQNRNHLSLLIHGNNHTAQELARSCSAEERNQILRQVLGRIAMMEHRSGLEISRVMVPPHGAYSEDFIGATAELGFEAACVSGGSLRKYNSQAKWLHTLGMKPVDIIAGLPVFPRFRLDQSCHNNILAAALFNQPIIPVGHHHDIAHGLRLLAEMSKFINSIGSLQWADMKQISRSRFARMIDGNILRVKMFTKRIEILVPEEIKQVWVERSWLKKSGFETLACCNSGGISEWKPQHPEEPIAVEPGQRIEIISNPIRPPLIDAKSVTKLHLWPYLRRFLTETRDRTTPALRRFLL